MRQSEYVTYPEFEFNGAILRECDTEGYSEYLKWYDKLKEDEEYLLASCKKCQMEHVFIIKKVAAAKYREYQAGAPYLIQDIFSDMKPAERGLLAVGQNMFPDCLGRCWDNCLTRKKARPFRQPTRAGFLIKGDRKHGIEKCAFFPK